MTRGGLIVLEGIDGSGTTTQTQLLCEELRRRGRKVTQTREPFDASLTKRIRAWLKDETPPHHALLLAFALDRQVHLRECIIPAIKRGELVVCDRYALSTIAYQAQHNDSMLIRELCSYAPEPDLTILLDVPVDVALARVRRRAMPLDAYERDVQLQQRVALAYRWTMDAKRRSNTIGPRYVTLYCGDLSILDLHAEVFHAVEQDGIA